MTLSNGNGDTMILGEFQCEVSGSELAYDGTGTLVLGGTLHLAGNQPRGYYSGSFDVNVNYD